MATNQGFKSLVPHEGVDSAFLYYAVRAAHPELVRRGAGSTFAEVSRASLEAIRVPYSSLEEQQRIARALLLMDAGIDTVRRMGGAYRRLKDACFSRTILRGSCATIVRDWGRVDSGRMRSPAFVHGRERPYLRVANVLDGRIDTSDVLTMRFTDEEFTRYQLHPGDVLLNEGQSLELAGRCARYEGDPPRCAFQNSLLRFRAGPDADPAFATHYFRHLQAIGRFARVAQQTTSIAHLGAERFARMRIAVPPLAEQQRIAALMDHMDAELDTLRRMADAYRRLKRALLQKLMRGELALADD
jgi:type I restriction enzyme S subunit